MTKHLLLTLSILLFTTNCFSAELLVKARSHRLDSFTSAEISKMVADKKITLESYNARTQIGDIIVVRPDGWKWGKEECLPNFIVVQLPNISIDTVKYYEQSLMDITDQKNPKMLKVRKYRVPPTYVTNLVSQNKSIVKIATGQITNFRGTIIQKTE